MEGDFISDPVGLGSQDRTENDKGEVINEDDTNVKRY